MQMDSNATMETGVGPTLDGISRVVFHHTRVLFYGVSHAQMVDSIPPVLLPSPASHAADAAGSISLHQLRSSGLPNFIVQAIPGFALLMIVELLVGLARGKKLYRLSDGVMSVLLGSFQTIVGSLFRGALGFGAYTYVWNNYGYKSLIPIDSWWNWLGLFLGKDFAYYWFHRIAHEFHFAWATHSVHHSGEDYNLATALRQGALQSLFSWPFSLLLALVFHPALFYMHSALNTLGQFWIHTQVIGSCGPIEYIFNTPSHHRMHHRPPGNCNYAGVLIVWDRMFGTFVPEDEQKDLYGLARQYNTFDPIWANAEHSRRVVTNVGRKYRNQWLPVRWSNYAASFCRKRVHHKFVFDLGAPFRAIPSPRKSLWVLPESPSRRKLESRASHPVLCLYIFAQFVLTVAGVYVFLQQAPNLEVTTTLAIFGALAVRMSSLGQLLDGTKRALVIETARVVGLAALVWSGAADGVVPMSIRATALRAVQSQALIWLVLGGVSLPLMRSDLVGKDD